MADKAMVNLYDAEGAHAGQAEFDGDPSSAQVIKVGERVYVWNQRNAQFRETELMSGKSAKAEVPDTGLSPAAVTFTLDNPHPEPVKSAKD